MGELFRNPVSVLLFLLFVALAGLFVMAERGSVLAVIALASFGAALFMGTGALLTSYFVRQANIAEANRMAMNAQENAELLSEQMRGQKLVNDALTSQNRALVTQQKLIPPVTIGDNGGENSFVLDDSIFEELE